jgi:hypothetical protein
MSHNKAMYVGMYEHTLRYVCTTVVAAEKQLSIQYFDSVSVALVMQHAMHMCIICGLSGSPIFSHIIS